MKRKIFLLIAIVSLLLLSFSFSTAAVGYFDETDLDKGLIHITYQSSGARVKVMIEKDTKRYTYDLSSSSMESFPLQMGNGSYKISILENISGNSYRLITSINAEANSKDPNLVFLNSIQNVNWNVDSESVKKAVAMTKDYPDLAKKARILWNYMAKNNKYDYKKLSTLKLSYVPIIDATLQEKTGICYDFSALFAAMLRSQGIPAKLVKGYAPKYATGYHAWNEVYDAPTKTWLVIDSTYDLQMMKLRPKVVTMIKSTSAYQKVYEY
ncbi:MAG: transglutaminase-like domain-containing protein [Clostridia bacterium]